MDDTYNMTVDLNVHRWINPHRNDLNELAAAVGWTERHPKERARR
jgi:hypothetical protein